MKLKQSSVRLTIALALGLATHCCDPTGIGVALNAAHAEESTEGIEAELRAVVEANLEGVAKEDVDAAMGTFHSQSPSYLPTKQATEQLFKLYDVEASLDEYHYVGRDETYAIARVVQRVVKIKGPAFKNNSMDTLWVFRQEEGKWKLWTMATLTIKFLEEE